MSAAPRSASRSVAIPSPLPHPITILMLKCASTPPFPPKTVRGRTTQTIRGNIAALRTVAAGDGLSGSMVSRVCAAKYPAAQGQGPASCSESNPRVSGNLHPEGKGVCCNC